MNTFLTPFSIYYYSVNNREIKNFNGFWEPDGTLNSINDLEPGKGCFVKGK